jgi:hypothetical protein
MSGTYDGGTLHRCLIGMSSKVPDKQKHGGESRASNPGYPMRRLAFTLKCGDHAESLASVDTDQQVASK